MAFPTSLMQFGMPSNLAIEVEGRVQGGLTAAGTTQANALLLPAIVNVVTTTAASTGVRLPPVEISASVTVANLGANALLVYPSTGQTINTASANAGLSVAAGKTVQLFGISGTGWIAQVGA